MIARYGNERVKRGIQHFFLGKGISALAGFGAILLVVRNLSIADFAKYSVLIALVEVFTAIAGFGLVHLILRYVPELYSKYQTTLLKKLVVIATSLRTFLLLVLLGAGWYFSDTISGLIGLSEAVVAFECFLLVVAFRSTSHFLSQILESTLHQGITQTAFSVTAIGRYLGLWWLSHHHTINLVDVIVLEAICDAFACLFLLIGVISTLMEKRTDEQMMTETYDRKNEHMMRFAITAYLQHLATLPFGGNTNRLIGGAMFGEKIMANFGFAQSLYEFAKRYLPTQLLIGVIRPIVVARYSTTKDFSVAAKLCEQSLQFNLALLSGGLAVLFVSGAELLYFISKGKYAGESLIILTALIFFLALETQRLILEVMAQTVERYDILIPSNIFLSVSIIFGIVGYKFIGAIAFPLANAGALILSNFWIIKKLASLGYRYQHDWMGTLTSLFILLVSTAIGWLFKLAGLHWIGVMIMTILVYAGLLYRFKLKFLVTFVKDLIG